MLCHPEDIVDLIDAGFTSVPVAVQAHKRVQSRHIRGKVVLRGWLRLQINDETLHTVLGSSHINPYGTSSTSLKTRQVWTETYVGPKISDSCGIGPLELLKLVFSHGVELSVVSFVRILKTVYFN